MMMTTMMNVPVSNVVQCRKSRPNSIKHMKMPCDGCVPSYVCSRRRIVPCSVHKANVEDGVIQRDLSDLKRSKMDMIRNRRFLLSSVTGLFAYFVFQIENNDAFASGLESMEMPAPSTPDIVKRIQERNKKTLDDAESKFQESDLLKTLKERSEANRDSNKKRLLDTYCRRQAELGVGDCAGLRLIPGATKSGVQKRPEFLEKLFKSDSDSS